MDHEYQKRLEAEIDRELKSLPQLQAPDSLARRVLASIAQRNSVPWYRQSWEMWPAPLRYGTLAFLLAAFGALCFASWELTRAAGFATAMEEVGQVFSGVTVLWNALNALALAAVLVIKHMGTPFIVALCAAIAFAYVICVGIGTAVVRLALAQRHQRPPL